MPSGLPPATPPSGSTISGSYQNGVASNGDGAYIEHLVSKLDTLAGIAIKYGVEVADVKRANGLVTDLQMFGHRTLKIPLPGKGHSPPPRNSYKKKPPSSLQNRYVASQQPIRSPDSKGKEKRPLSSAMNLLRGYYGLSSPAQRNMSEEGMEMTSYNSDGQDFSEEDPFSPIEPTRNGKALNGNSNPSTDFRRTREFSRLNDSYTPAAVLGSCSNAVDAEKVSVRRRSKADSLISARSCSPEFDTRREPSPSERTVQGSSVLLGSRTPGPFKLNDGNAKEMYTSKVIKSLSTSNLQDQVNMQTNLVDDKYGGKTDLKSVTPSIPSRSLFEGFSKPIAQRYKEAVD